MPFKPTNRSDLDTAINAWIANSITSTTEVGDENKTTNNDATETYGAMGTWDVTAVTDMSQLFSNKSSFNEDITGWNVSYVTNMNRMFQNATSFDQPIKVWSPNNDLEDNNELFRMFYNTPKMSTRYAGDPWFRESPFRRFFGYTPRFTSGALTGVNQDQQYTYNIGVSDYDGDAVTVTAPTKPNWLELNGNTLSGPAPSTLGTHDVVLIATDSTGATARQSFTLTVNPKSGFQPTTRSQLKDAVDKWIAKTITEIDTVPSGQGSGYYGFINEWDVSGVDDMSYLFSDKSTFNEKISGWDVSNVTNMSYMFNGASAFNQNITGWNMSKVANTSWMFNNAANFRWRVKVWTVADSCNMANMFRGASGMIQIYGNTANFGNNNNGYTPNRAFFGYVVNYTSSAIFNPLENQTTIGNVIATHKFGNTLTYSISGNDADTSNPYHILINSSTGVLTFNSGPEFENPGSAAGTNTYTVTVTASGGGNSRAQNVTVYLINDNVPVFTTTGPTTAQVKESYIYRIGISDTDVYSVLTVTATTKPNWLSFDSATNSLTGIPKNADVGTHNVELTLDDRRNTVTQTFTITVKEENIITVTVVQDSGNKYVLNGNTSTKPVFYIGKTYVFDMSDSSNSGHPLEIHSNQGGNKFDSFTTEGIAGEEGSKVTFTPTANLPYAYLYCTNHGYGMGDYYTPLNVVGSETVLIKTDNTQFIRSFSGTLTKNNYESLVSLPNLKFIYIGTDVTEIGEKAFEGSYGNYGNNMNSFTGLQYVTIPDSVTSIGNSAFEYSSRLQSVTIPDSVKSIGDNAFTFCRSLQSLTLPTNVNFTSISNGLFSMCSALHSVTIPDSVTSIGISAFSNTALQSVIIPNSITSIGIYAFERCSELQSVSIGDSVTSIGNWAFYYCSALQSVTIPDSVTSIGSYAFRVCVGLKSAIIGDGVNSLAISYGGGGGGSGQFMGCTNLRTVVIGRSITKIGFNMFSSCTNLRSVMIFSDALNEILTSAFYLCSSLKTLSIPGTVSSISNIRTFQNSGITTINLLDSENNLGLSVGSTVTLGEKANITVKNVTTFTRIDGVTEDVDVSGELNSSHYPTSWYAWEIKYVSIPHVVTSIGDNAFNGCNGLERILIPDNVTSIGDSAFKGCNRLTKLNLPLTVTSIGASAFHGCSKLDSIKISYGVQSIGDNTFADCVALESLSLPDTVTSVGSNAFQNSGITTINLLGIQLLDFVSGSGLTIGTNKTFGGKSGLTIQVITNVVKKSNNSVVEIRSEDLVQEGILYPEDYVSRSIAANDIKHVTIGSDVTSIGRSALRGCSALETVTIYPSVINIGSGAFEYCHALKSLSIPDSVTTLGSNVFKDNGITNFNVTKTNGLNLSHFFTDIGTSDTGSILVVFSDTEFIKTDGTKVDVNVSGEITSSNYPSGWVASDIKRVNIGSNVTSIGNDTFKNCTALKSAIIPNSVTSIGNNIFESCSELQNVIIGEDVTTIGNEAFKSCIKLQSIVIPDSVTSIGINAFKTCTTLRCVTLPTNDNFTNINNYVFTNCSALTTLIIPDSVTTISDNAFENSGSGGLATLYMTSNNGLGLSAGSEQVIGGKNVSVYFPYKPASRANLSGALNKWYQKANNANDADALNTANNYAGTGSGDDYNTPPNTWDVTSIVNMGSLFSQLPNMSNYTVHPEINGWNVSKVRNMGYMFSGVTHFNKPIGDWCLNSLGNMRNMFDGATSFNQPIGDWCLNSLLNITRVFFNATSFNQPIENWNVYSITNMRDIFVGATSFNQPLNLWDVSNMTTMSRMFDQAPSFNGDISQWNVSNVTNMSYMFNEATSFNQPLNLWDVSNVTTMERMFNQATSFNGDISQWNVSNVTNMSYMFNEASLFNKNISGWERIGSTLGNVTNMESMFFKASAFNQPMNSWNVSSVENMSNMFSDASSFNGDISQWNVSNVTNMFRMFRKATSFNQNISGWERTGSTLGNVTNMQSMFYEAIAFNQPIGNWNVSSVTDMAYMFQLATNFNEDITAWDVSNVTNMQAMFMNAYKFNQNIVEWNVGNVQNMTEVFQGSLTFQNNFGGVRRRSDFRAQGQTTYEHPRGSESWGGFAISSGELNLPLKFTNNGFFFFKAYNLSANNVNIKFRLEKELYVATSGDPKQSDDDSYETDEITITSGTTIYVQTIPAQGDKEFRNVMLYVVTKDVPVIINGVTINNDTPSNSMSFDQNINHWNVKKSAEFHWMFESSGITNGKYGLSVPTPNYAQFDKFYPRNKTDLQDAITAWTNGTANADSVPPSGLGGVYGPMKYWNVTLITDMSKLFFKKTTFNEDISEWDVSNVTNMYIMFREASSFNQPIGNWDVSNVRNMLGMFADARTFNQNISEWNVSNVSNMSNMFLRAYLFNQNISGWERTGSTLGNVKNMSRMFGGTRAFDQPIGNWNVSSVTDMRFMFVDANEFTQELRTWNPPIDVKLASMFNQANGMISKYSSFTGFGATPTIDFFQITPPTFKSAGKTNATQDQLYSYTITTADTSLVEVIEKPDWLEFNANTNVLSGTPENSDVGGHDVKLRASDGSVRVMQEFTIVVANVDDPSTITSVAPTKATQNKLYRYEVETSDPDVGDFVIVTATTIPSWLEFNANTNVLSGIPENSDVGSHNVKLTAGVGALSTIQEFTIKVENVNDPPNITSTAPTTAVANELYRYEVKTSDPDVGDTVTVAAKIIPDWLEFDSNTNILSGTPENSDVGNDNDIELEVSDAGSLSTIQEFTIEVSIRPEFTSVPLENITRGFTYNYPVLTNYASEVTVTRKPNWLTFNVENLLLFGTPAKNDVGSHIVELKAENEKDLSKTQRFTIVVKDIPATPAITSRVPTSAIPGELYEYKISADALTPEDDNEENSEESIVIEPVVIPDWATFNTTTNVLSGTPSVGDVGQNFAVNLTVTIGNTISTQSFSIQVSNATDPKFESSASTFSAYSFGNGGAVIMSRPKRRLFGTESVIRRSDIYGNRPVPSKIGQQYSYTPTATDLNGNSLLIRVTTKPGWLLFDGTTLLGTPSIDDVGTHSVVLTATDSTGVSTRQIFVITIANVDDPPTFISEGNTNAFRGQQYSYKITTNDGGRGKVKVTAETKPDWLSFNGTTLSGVPTISDVGSHDVVLTATDGALTARQSFTIFAMENTRLKFTSTPLRNARQELLYKYRATTYPDGNNVSVTATQIPSWLSFDQNTNVLSGTATRGVWGKYRIVLTAKEESLDGSEPLTATQEFTIMVRNPVCFRAGTGILSLKNGKEQYVGVGRLMEGDLVKTLNHGYKKIVDIRKGNFKLNGLLDMGLYRMKKQGNMIADLEISGLHCVLVDAKDKEYREDIKRQGGLNKEKYFIDGKFRLRAKESHKFEQMEPGTYSIFAFALENEEQEQYGIWANGALVETTSRKMLEISNMIKIGKVVEEKQ